ncbi:MAG: DUF11 domain-containing protein [Anaerolineae bacterium]|nr:DUF11 domain-containing protein [Anaerolineae bacterium]
MSKTSPNIRHTLFILAMLACLSIVVVTGTFAVDSSAQHQNQVAKLPTKDGYVASGRPNQSWPNLHTLWTGHDQSAGYGTEYILLQFALTDVAPNSSIQSAKLKLFMNGTTPNDVPMTITARLVTDNDWQEDITWSQFQNLQVSVSPSATAPVGLQSGPYEWDVTEILQEWANNRPITGLFSLVLQSNATSGQHERVFWSRDCSNTECGPVPGNRPVLEIDYALPTATPTASSTPGPILTPTPTPTAGLKSFVLRNIPNKALDPGDEVTYVIQYKNGWLPLTGFEITNDIPNGLVLVPGSISNEGTVSGNTVRWVIGNLVRDSSGTTSYRAARPTFTPVPPTNTPVPPTNTPVPTTTPALSINVTNTSSRSWVLVGDTYWYDIRVTNTSPERIIDSVFVSDGYRFDPQYQCVTAISSSHSGCLNYPSPAGSFWDCEIYTTLYPGQSLTIRFTFEAIGVCDGTQNYNHGIAIAYQNGQASNSDGETIFVPIYASSNHNSLEESLINTGAHASGRYNGQPLPTITSNKTTNPGGNLWLPIVHAK